MSEREEGFYWVKVQGSDDWSVCQWFRPYFESDEGHWQQTGADIPVEVHQVGPRIEPPGETEFGL